MTEAGEEIQDSLSCFEKTFGDLSADDVERLRESSHVIQRPKGNLIYDEGDSAIEGYCICSGSVEIFKRIERGGALVLRTAHAGSLLGVEEILAEHGAYRTSARALFDVRLVGLPREEILSLVRSSPGFARSIAEWLSHDLNRLRDELTSHVEKPLSDRLKAKLCELADQYGSPTDGWVRIDLKLTNAELAQLVGTTPGTVSMLLRDLKDEGTIARKGRRFLINDAEIYQRAY